MLIWSSHKSVTCKVVGISDIKLFPIGVFLSEKSCIDENKFYFWTSQKICSKGNASDLYSGDDKFESRRGFRGFGSFTKVLPAKCREDIYKLAHNSFFPFSF
jgi:hypothetical protein